MRQLRGPETQAFGISQPRTPWGTEPGWGGLGEDPSEGKQLATLWPIGMQAGQGTRQRARHGTDAVPEYLHRPRDPVPVPGLKWETTFLRIKGVMGASS